MPRKPLAIRTLEFLNFLEDDRPRLSWTRIGFAIFLALAVYVVLKTVGGGEASTIAGSVVAAVTALAAGSNYIHQRMAWYSQPQEQRPHGEPVDDPDRN